MGKSSWLASVALRSTALALLAAKIAGPAGLIPENPAGGSGLDLVIARYARRVNDTDTFALTKMDILDRCDSSKVCVAYRIDGE